MSQAFPHEPVMAAEVIDLLGRRAGRVGARRHARRRRPRAAPCSRRTRDIRLLGIDRDPMAVAAATGELAVFGRRAIIRRARFDSLGEVVRQVQDELGTPDDRARPHRGALRPRSQLAPARRGRARLLLPTGRPARHADGPDRRAHRRRRGERVPTRTTLVELFADNGETRFARRIARAIIAARPITTTGQLADVVRDAIPAATRRTGGHPARRVFQAIRIAVNEELDQLRTGLDAALGLLRPGGRCVVISYHSGEDRLVKATFTRAAHRRLPVPARPALRVRRRSRSSVWSTAARDARPRKRSPATTGPRPRACGSSSACPPPHSAVQQTARWPDGTARHRHRPPSRDGRPPVPSGHPSSPAAHLRAGAASVDPARTVPARPRVAGRRPSWSPACSSW